MRASFFVACLAIAGDARRIHNGEADAAVERRERETTLSQHMRMLSVALLLHNPAAGFNPAAPISRGAAHHSQRKIAEPTQLKGRSIGPVSMDERTWTMDDITPDGKLAQRVEGKTRKTWKFSDTSKDRVQVAVVSEGRPVHADLQLWLGPDWTPAMLKAYSEDGKLRPIQTLIGTRNKEATIEVRNTGEYEFPLMAASNYAKDAMAALPDAIPAATDGERVDGQALTSFTVDPGAKQVEVVLKTEGKQLNARIELLNAPNNPKQTFETFTNNGELNSLVACFNIIDSGNTVRVVNLAPVEFPLYVHLNQIE